MLELVTKQIEQVKQSYTVTDVSERPDGSVQITIAGMPTPANPNRDKIDVLLLLPPGFPQAMPNGFSAKLDGSNWSNVCFRPGSWNSARDNAWKWVKMIEQYFEENKT